MERIRAAQKTRTGSVRRGSSSAVTAVWAVAGLAALAGATAGTAYGASGPWRLVQTFSTVRDQLAVGGGCSGRVYAKGGPELDAGDATHIRLQPGQVVGLPAGTNPRFLSIAAAGKRPRIAYAASGQAGVFKTTDGGRSWRLVMGLTAHRTTYPVAVATSGNGGTVYVGLAGASPGLLVSTDGGTRWRPAAAITLRGTTSLPEGPVVDPTRASTVYVGFIGTRGPGERPLYGLAVSSDAGRTWRVRTFARSAVSALAVMPKTPRVVVAGTVHGLYRSTDGGGSWRPLVSAGISDFGGDLAEIRRLVATADGRLFALTPTGVWTSRDRGENWIRLTRQAGTVRPLDIALSPEGTRLIAVGATASGGGVAVLPLGSPTPRCAA